MNDPTIDDDRWRDNGSFDAENAGQRWGRDPSLEWHLKEKEKHAFVGVVLLGRCQQTVGDFKLTLHFTEGREQVEFDSRFSTEAILKMSIAFLYLCQVLIENFGVGLRFSILQQRLKQNIGMMLRTSLDPNARRTHSSG